MPRDLKRKTEAILTINGNYVWPLEPRAGDVLVIEDAAWALSHMPRFAGHTKRFYSVGQHSLYVSECVESLGGSKLDILKGLLHDVPEGFGFCDLPRPVKRSMPKYVAAERRFFAAFCDAIGIEPGIPEIVKRADDMVLQAEMRDLTRHRDVGYDVHGDAWPEDRIVPAVRSDVVYARFLHAYQQLRKAV